MEMALIDSVIVQVPATTANIGPGFDCFGAALTLYNQFKFTLTDSETTIIVTGAEASKINVDKSNLLYQAFVKFYEHLDQIPPSVAIEIRLGVPPARGLGSSATAIVGGLVAANYLAGNPLSKEEIAVLAIAMEGHPDNVVPALLGNCILSVFSKQKWQFVPIPWRENIIPVVAIPEFELSTKEARQVLPLQFSDADAIFNIAHFGLLLRGLETGNADWLNSALDDRLHQPYRESLIQGFLAIKKEAIAAGAYGMVISGAGPTLLALVAKSQVQVVCQAIEEAYQIQDIKVNVRSLLLDTQGSMIIKN